MQLTGAAPGLSCRLVAVATSGHREVAATWRVARSGRATVSGTTALTPARLARLMVQTVGDRVLVQLPVHPQTLTKSWTTATADVTRMHPPGRG